MGNRPRVVLPRSRIVIKRRYYGSPAKAEVDGHLYQGATPFDILVCLGDAGLGSRPVSDRGFS